MNMHCGIGDEVALDLPEQLYGSIQSPSEPLDELSQQCHHVSSSRPNSSRPWVNTMAAIHPDERGLEHGFRQPPSTVAHHTIDQPFLTPPISGSIRNFFPSNHHGLSPFPAVGTSDGDYDYSDFEPYGLTDGQQIAFEESEDSGSRMSEYYQSDVTTEPEISQNQFESDAAAKLDVPTSQYRWRDVEPLGLSTNVDISHEDSDFTSQVASKRIKMSAESSKQTNPAALPDTTNSPNTFSPWEFIDDPGSTSAVSAITDSSLLEVVRRAPSQEAPREALLSANVPFITPSASPGALCDTNAVDTSPGPLFQSSSSQLEYRQAEVFPEHVLKFMNDLPCDHSWPDAFAEQTRPPRNPSFPQDHTRLYVPAPSRKRRARFESSQDRENTTLTRRIGACIRCRYQRVTCRPDPGNPGGECLTCKDIKRPTASNLPCMRYKISDASVYRHQDMPFQKFSKRWKSMDLVDIVDWDGPEIKTVTLSQVFLDAPFQVEVRRFIPEEGDMICEQWQDGDKTYYHDIPPYAFVNLQRTKKAYGELIEHGICKYVDGVLGHRDLDALFVVTYEECTRHRLQAKTPFESGLIFNALKLWVTCRLSSHPHRIISKEKLGGKPVQNRASPQYGMVPMPPLMIAQKELIIYSQFLQPLSHIVLRDLQRLIYNNKRESWYTIYLIMFMLLHSCSMITRRDEEYARQIHLEDRYANMEAIEAHHTGAKIMLAHLHYINKGEKPFSDALDSRKLKCLVTEVGMTQHQADFVRDTALHIKRLEQKLQEVGGGKDYGNDFYWVSQMYQDDWRPRIFVD